MFARPRAGRTLILGVLVSAVSLLGLLQAPAWGQPGEKTVGGEAPPPVAAGAAQARGSHAAGAPLSVNVGLSVRESAQLDEVIAAASTPGSPSYGHYLTEPEYLASYAPTDAQVAAVESWLSEQRTLWQARTDRLADYVETQMSRSVEDAD